MSKLRVHAFTISVDGYGAGADQGLKDPLGRGGEDLHAWMTRTRTFKRMVSEPGGETGLADDLTARGFENIGAWIMGRNMFGPSRGAWTEDQWRGWWGDEPPYHAPVFVLTHHARGPIEMAGGTTFHFVTEGAQVAPKPPIRRPSELPLAPLSVAENDGATTHSVSLPSDRLQLLAALVTGLVTALALAYALLH